MISESGSELVVRFYRYVKLPQQCTPVADLFHGPAFDTSFCQHGSLRWLFTTLQHPRGQGVALYLFFSENPTGKWQHHPANPISYDARNACCGEHRFKSDGKLIRPSQNGTIRYGHSFSTQRSCYFDAVRNTRSEQ